MYLLDTNICIFLINKKPIYVLDRLRKEMRKGVCLSAISIGELHYGACNSVHYEKNRIALAQFAAPFEILDFDGIDAEAYGKIRSDLKRRGMMIGPYDLQIAAQALRRDLVLVTNNTGEFSRIPGLKLEDWK